MKTVRDKLAETYPDGIVLGRSKGIVGAAGLLVEWVNAGGEKQQEKFEENEEVSIVRHELHKVEISARGKMAIVPTVFLKGLIINK